MDKLPLALCKDPPSVMTSSTMICDNCIWMRWKSSLRSASVISPLSLVHSWRLDGHLVFSASRTNPLM